uniref:Uncharacterized protein n=1 Tax=Biomphalaria glabrata TaxID=6526 RepID=A0A2C9LPH6_BIOGL
MNFHHFIPCVVCVLLLFFQDGLSVEHKVSESCRVSIADCYLRVSRLNQQETADLCKMMTTKYRSVTAYHCLVRVGLCTEGEYDILKTLACQDSPNFQPASALAKLKLYRTINLANKTCQSQMLVCIRKYITAIVLKQQEHYCALVDLDINGVTSKSCLAENRACSDYDYQTIKEAACDTALIEKDFTPFVNAIQAITTQCRHSIETCYSRSQNVRLLINSEQYCQVMHVEESGSSTYHCLVVQGSCSKEEFEQLEQSACKGISIHSNTVTVVLGLAIALLKLDRQP